MMTNGAKVDLLTKIFNQGSPYGNTLKGLLFTAFPGRAGNPTTNIATYSGYAAVDLTANDSSQFTIASPGEVRLAATVPFAPAAGSQTVSWFGVADGETSGDNLLAVAPLGGTIPQSFVADSGHLLTDGTHGLQANDTVVLLDVPYDRTFPSGGSVAVGTLYHVIASGLTSTAFKISATQGGAELELGAGFGKWSRINPVDLVVDRAVTIKSYAQQATPLIVLA